MLCSKGDHKLLKEMREFIKVVKMLMKSGNEDVRLDDVRQFMGLGRHSSQPLQFDVGEDGDWMRAEDRNLLVRRSRHGR